MSPADLFLDLWDVAFGAASTVRAPECPEWLVLEGRLRRGDGPDAMMAAAHIRAGVDYRDRSEPDAAHAHFRAAFAYAAPSPDACLQIGATLMQTGDRSGAEAVLRRAVDAGLATSPIFVHLAHAIWGQGRQDDAISLIDRAARSLPNDGAVTETAALFEMLHGRPADACDRTLAFLDRQPALDEAGARALRKIAVQASIGANRALPLGQLRQLAEDAEAGDEEARRLHALFEARGDVRALWTQLFAAQAINSSLAATVRASPHLDEVLRLERPSQVMALGSEEAAAHYGPALVTPDALVLDGFDLPLSLGVAHRGFMTTATAERLTLIAAARRLQLGCLRDGALRLHSPFGGMATSRSGTILNYAPERRELGSVIAYYCAAPRPAFVFVVTEDHWPLAWYDPVDDVILRHDSMPEFETYLQHRVVELKRVWLRLSEEVRDYLADDRRSTILYPAIVEYLSTHLFAELQGLLVIVENQAIDHVAAIACVSPEPLGPIQTLLPEYAGKTIDRSVFADDVALNRALFGQRHFPVRVTGGMADDGLTGRVAAQARSTATADWIAEIERLRAPHWPLLFVSLRSRSRRLRLSGEEIAGFFNRVASVHPDLALVFDGYALADRPIDPAVLRDEAAVIDGIVQHLSVPALRSAGRSMSDSIYAAIRCDLHLSEQGTSTTKGALIANRPGVVIGPRQFGWDVRAFRDPSPLLLTPWEQAEDVVEGDIQTDYRLAPAVICDALLDAIGFLPPRDHP